MKTEPVMLLPPQFGDQLQETCEAMACNNYLSSLS
jgi:hypothetical protein